jgi:hypothetical protein
MKTPSSRFIIFRASILVEFGHTIDLSTIVRWERRKRASIRSTISVMGFWDNGTRTLAGPIIASWI